MSMGIRKILYIILVVLVMIGVAGAYYLHSKPLTAHLNIQVAPKSSTITIDGKKMSAGTANLKPGSHVIVVTHKGFADQKYTEILAKGETKYLGVLLTPNSQSTQNWFSSHPDDQKLAESISGKSLASDSAAQVSKLPIISQLPFIDNSYRIDYGPSKANPGDPASVAIYIEYYSLEGKQQALDWLKFKGYDPAKLEIIYTDASY